MTPLSSAAELERLLDRRMNTAIISHFNPDGDAVGSSVGMMEFLKTLGIPATVILPSERPSMLGFLDPDNKIVCYTADEEKATSVISSSGLIICLDFNKFERTESMAGILSSADAVKVMIDHHPNPKTEGFELVISDPEASSTCELLFRTLMSLSTVSGHAEKIGLPSLTALAAGMLTDTNNFNNSLTPYTFTAASEMLRAGVDFDNLNNLLFKQFSEGRMRMMGHLLSDLMVISPEFRASCMILTLEDREKFGLKDGDSEGFVNLPLMIRDVEISALFTETKDYVKVSLRSKGAISVNALSKAFFNGGGHERAAGGRLYIPISGVRSYYLKALEQFLQTTTPDRQ